MAQESGVRGKLVSLGGISGTVGRGRQIEPSNWPITELTQILNENGRRISAIIENVGALDATIYFGSDVIGITLAVGANLQIDWNFPWTGNVWADELTAVGTTLEVIEVSVPG